MSLTTYLFTWGEITGSLHGEHRYALRVVDGSLECWTLAATQSYKSRHGAKILSPFEENPYDIHISLI